MFHTVGDWGDAADCARGQGGVGDCPSGDEGGFPLDADARD